MTTPQPYKSNRHSALGAENLAEQQAETARRIARAFAGVKVPRTSRHRPGFIARCLRALWAWL